MHAEAAGNPLFPAGVDQAARQHGGQGDAVRRRPSAACSRPSRPARAPARSTPGTTASSRSAASSRCSTCELGEITPGGIGAGMYGMLVIGAILAGLHRRPDGRPDARVPRQEGREPSRSRWRCSSPSSSAPASSASPPSRPCYPEGLAGPLNPGPHGFSEILYAFSQPDRQQRLGVRRPDRQHALLQRHRRASRCSSAATG